MVVDPTRSYIFERREIDRTAPPGAVAPPFGGHWRLASVTALDGFSANPPVLLVWEPILLDEAQDAAWKTAHVTEDHINTLDLSPQTRQTLENAGLTSIAAIKALSDEEVKRIRLSGPLRFGEVNAIRGKK